MYIIALILRVYSFFFGLTYNRCLQKMVKKIGLKVDNEQIGRGQSDRDKNTK